MDEPVLPQEYQLAGCFDDKTQPHYCQAVKDLHRFYILKHLIYMK